MTIKNPFLVYLFYILFIPNICHSQDDSTKAFLFMSIYGEESDLYYESSIDNVKEFIERYDMFKYDCTPILEIPVSEYRHDPMQDYEKYKIQLFRIQTSSQLRPYYVLKMYSCNTILFSLPETIWLRVSGYKECDFKIFFDALKRQGMRINDFKIMVNQWMLSHKMFEEIDWDCILNGYRKNNTHGDCYLSNSYLLYCARYRNRLFDASAIFSKKTLSGMIP